MSDERAARSGEAEGERHEREDFVRGWSEGWQCACLKADGSLPPQSQVREALTFAGFADELIDVALAEDAEPRQDQPVDRASEPSKTYECRDKHGDQRTRVPHTHVRRSVEHPETGEREAVEGGAVHARKASADPDDGRAALNCPEHPETGA